MPGAIHQHEPLCRNRLKSDQGFPEPRQGAPGPLIAGSNSIVASGDLLQKENRLGGRFVCILVGFQPELPRLEPPTYRL